MKQNPTIQTQDLGQLAYEPALQRQRELNQGVIDGTTPPTLLLVEHPPVITLTRRSGPHLLADEATLAAKGIQTAETDRGGDITYHGPGQLVVYPILKLGDFGLNLSSYMRLLERAVIDTVANWGIKAHNECGATGVWVPGTMVAGGWRMADEQRDKTQASADPNAQSLPPNTHAAKLCAMGVRIRKNTTLHGLALNVDPDMSHFDLIVPCGLQGRHVTSLHQLLGKQCPSMQQVKETFTQMFMNRLANKGQATRCAT